MSLGDKDVKVRMTWDDEASGPARRTVAQITSDWRRFNQEQLAAKREFRMMHRDAMDIAGGLQAIGRFGGMATMMWTKYNVQLIKNQQATRDLKDAQRELQKAMIEFGPQSEQVAEAIDNVTQAEDEMKRANQENILFLALLGIEGAQAAAALIQSIPKFRQFAVGLRNVFTSEFPTPNTGGSTLKNGANGAPVTGPRGSGAGQQDALGNMQRQGSGASEDGAPVRGGNSGGMSRGFFAGNVGLGAMLTAGIVVETMRALGYDTSAIDSFFGYEPAVKTDAQLIQEAEERARQQANNPANQGMFGPGGNSTSIGEINITINGSDPDAVVNETLDRLARYGISVPQ